MKSDLIEMFFQDISPLFMVIMDEFEFLLLLLDIEVDMCLFDHESDIEVEEQMHCIIDDATLMNCDRDNLSLVGFFPMRFVEDLSKRLFADGLEKLSFHLLSIFFYIL